MKIISWNVNGLRKGVEKVLENIVITEKPDIICIQETKCTEKDADKIFENSNLYKLYQYRYWNDGINGRAGVCTWSTIKPNKIKYEIPNLFQLKNGRIIILEFNNFVSINTYVPNTGKGNIAEIDRTIWHNSISEYMKKNIKKNSIWSGDLNIVREPILDSSNHVKRNERIAGLKKFEKEQFDEYIQIGLVDAFRYFYPKTKSMTWYSARHKNSQMRLDYFLVSKIKNVKNVKHSDYYGSKVSDHSWISIEF